MTRDEVVRKISALLSKTTANGATQAESEAAFAKAAAIMDEYQISESDLQSKPDFGAGTVFEGASLSISATAALNVIQSAFPVKVLIIRSPNGTGKPRVTIKIFGDQVATQSAAWSYQFLTVTFEALWHAYKSPRRTAEVRQCFYIGLAEGLIRRIRDERDERSKAEPGTGIVLANNRAALSEAFKAAYGPVGRAKTQIDRRSVTDVAAHVALVAGRVAGGQINLARPVERQQRKALA